MIDTPGHTRGHVAFFFAEGGGAAVRRHAVFARLRPAAGGHRRRNVFGSLERLAALPDDTLVCCGHEYTQSNARFAVTVEPDNAALLARAPRR